MSPVAESLLRADLERVQHIVGDSWGRLRGASLFITGGTGFVGKWLLASLQHANEHLGLGCDITVLTRDADSFQRNYPEYARHVNLVKGDIQNFDLPQIRITHVIHAATDAVVTDRPLTTFDTCVTGTRSLLDQARARDVKNILLISSGAVYGKQPNTLSAIPESYVGAPDVARADSAYGEGKRAAEWLASAYSAEFSMNIKVARLFAFVGPYLPLDRHFAIGNFLKSALEGSPIEILGDGTPYRSYLHASDMSAWLWKILLSDLPHRTYNVGGSEILSIEQLARTIVDVVNPLCPVNVSRVAQPGVLADRYVPDVSRITSDIKLPIPLTLTESIFRTANWHRAVRN